MNPLGFILKKIRGKKRREEVERDLPFALMHLRTRLILGQQLEEALGRVSDSVQGTLRMELKAVQFEIEKKGASPNTAFLHSVARVESLQFKRAASQLMGLYEQGFSKNSLESLKTLHRDLLANQRTQMKDFAGKMAVYSLMFVAFSTVLPSLFLATILIGSMILKLDISPFTAFLLVIVVFPLIDIMVLLYIREKTPLFARF